MTADFQSMCTYWKQFDLPELQKSLDNTANELALKQEKCEFARKRLVELSREFKKTTPEDTRKQVAPLLKSFQQEIDSFSKRAKFAESSFLNLYKKLIEVPDPVPLIENCLALRERSQKNNDKEEENKQLRETLAEYHIEFADIKNQEITIKHLKEKLLHHDEKFESSIAIRCKERERQLERTYEDKENQQKDRELSLIKQLGDTERRLSSLTAVMEKTQTELFELKSQFDQNLQAKVDEMDIVLNDMDIATERAASMERENERLKTQLHKSMPSSDDNASSPGSPGNTATELDIEKQLHAELANKEKELTHLVDELQRLHSLVAKQQEQHASIIRKLERELCKSELDNDSLRKTIDEFSDYDEIKRELSVLKSLEFNNDSPSDTNDKEEDKQTKTLETLLMTKNRTLQTDNTRLKLTNGQLTSHYETLEGQYKDAYAVTQQQKELIVSLEEDLRNVNALSTMFRGDAEGESSSQIAEVLKDTNKDIQTPADCLLPIVISQRERFHSRAQQMQLEHTAQQEQIQSLTNDMDKLRRDNVKLFEKIRFLQSYPNKNKPRDIERDQTVERYHKEYEAKLDPFSTFSRKERARKYSDLKTYERIMLSMGRLIMGNRTARSFSFFYFLILHLLVFMVLYKLAYSTSTRWDQLEDCNNRFAQHMAQHKG